MRILFFTTALEHTTFRKTAKMLQNEGADVQMLGFTRSNFPISKEYKLEVKSFGSISHGNYFVRAIKLLKVIPALIRESKDTDVIYNFTLDTLIISKIFLSFKSKFWVYQIQDIRSVYFGSSIKNKLFRLLEKYFINRVDIVVVSSPDYYSGFLKKHYNLNEGKVYIIENKLSSETAGYSEQKRNITEEITIGYFGVLRCSRSWQILKNLAIINQNDYQVYVRGKPVSIDNIEEQVESINNITFEGPYRSPEDLEQLYTKIDIVWAAYPYSKKADGNWKYARTIRFYEACAYGKPVIVQKGTPQELDVLKYNIGLVVDMESVEDSINLIESITMAEIKEWTKNIKSLPSVYYYHTDEYKRLLNAMKKSTYE